LPEQEVTEDDERIMSMFMASDAAPQRTLADIIMERINEKDMGGNEAAEVEGQLCNF
jgi:essential nuclear protein 1